MKKLILLLLVLSVAGCKTKPIQAAYSLQTFPPVGTTETVGVGEQMLAQGDASTVDAIVLARDIMIGEVTVKQGTYPILSENEEYKQFHGVNIARAGRLSSRGKLFIFKKDEHGKTVCLGRTLCTDVEYTMGKATTYSRARNQQTLLYSGKIGNRVTLGYREFVNETARPAFSNDVDYDLNESNVLGYKGARIEVIKATNTEITYKVISGFN
jgi:hypothetical protein